MIVKFGLETFEVYVILTEYVSLVLTRFFLWSKVLIICSRDSNWYGNITICIYNIILVVGGKTLPIWIAEWVLVARSQAFTVRSSWCLQSKNSGIMISAYSNLLCALVTTSHQNTKSLKHSDIAMFEHELHVYTEIAQTHIPADSVLSPHSSWICCSSLICENDVPWFCWFYISIES